MPRLTVSVTDDVQQNLSLIAQQQRDSMSNVINQLIQIGMKHLDGSNNKTKLIDKHCQQLIIQMNALIKNLCAQTLKLDQVDFDKLLTLRRSCKNHLINSV